VWEIPRSTVYHHRHLRLLPRTLQKRGPKKSCLDDTTLLAAIRRDLEATPWKGEGHRKVWARLRFVDIRSSRDRIRRLMRENSLLAPQRSGRPHGPAAHDRTIIPAGANMMWGTDATSCMTLREGSAVVFIGVDHASTKCIGIHAAKRGTRWEALEPMRQGVKEEFGAYDKGVASGLKVRHDHGSTYTSDVFQGELIFLGIESSPSFVREPEGNGCAERFIRTLKEQLLWIRAFDTVEELRLALLDFRDQYNREWIIERHGYQSPGSQHERLLARQPQAA
jgi:transposase InsO family protein